MRKIILLFLCLALISQDAAAAVSLPLGPAASNVPAIFSQTALSSRTTFIRFGQDHRAFLLFWGVTMGALAVAGIHAFWTGEAIPASSLSVAMVYPTLGSMKRPSLQKNEPLSIDQQKAGDLLKEARLIKMPEVNDDLRDLSTHLNVSFQKAITKLDLETSKNENRSGIGALLSRLLAIKPTATIDFTKDVDLQKAVEEMFAKEYAELFDRLESHPEVNAVLFRYSARDFLEFRAYRDKKESVDVMLNAMDAQQKAGDLLKEARLIKMPEANDDLRALSTRLNGSFQKAITKLDLKTSKNENRSGIGALLSRLLAIKPTATIDFTKDVDLQKAVEERVAKEYAELFDKLKSHPEVNAVLFRYSARDFLEFRANRDKKEAVGVMLNAMDAHRNNPKQEENKTQLSSYIETLKASLAANPLRSDAEQLLGQMREQTPRNRILFNNEFLESTVKEISEIPALKASPEQIRRLALNWAMRWATIPDDKRPQASEALRTTLAQLLAYEIAQLLASPFWPWDPNAITRVMGHLSMEDALALWETPGPWKTASLKRDRLEAFFKEIVGRSKKKFELNAYLQRVRKEPNAETSFIGRAAQIEQLILNSSTKPQAHERSKNPLLLSLLEDLGQSGFSLRSFPHEELRQIVGLYPTDHQNKLMDRAYLFDILSLLAMRIWDDGIEQAAPHLQTVERLLGELQSRYEPVVEHVSQLFAFPISRVSQNEKEQVDLQRLLIALFGQEVGPNPHSRRFVHDQARHLRNILNHVPTKYADEAYTYRSLWRIRGMNSVDYATLILNLIPLLESYHRDGNQDGLAADIVAGLSADPPLLLDRELLQQFTLDFVSPFFEPEGNQPDLRNFYRLGAFYPHQLPSETLDHYFDLLSQCRERLLSDAESNIPEGPTFFSPLGRTDLYPTMLLTQFFLSPIHDTAQTPSLTYESVNRFSNDSRVLDNQSRLDRAAEDLRQYKGATPLTDETGPDYSSYSAEQRLWKTLHKLKTADFSSSFVRRASEISPVVLFVLIGAASLLAWHFGHFHDVMPMIAAIPPIRLKRMKHSRKAPQAPPNQWLSAMIESVIAKDRWVEALTPATSEEEGKKLGHLILEDRAYLDELEQRLTDKGQAWALLFEKAEDGLFRDGNHEANLTMMSIPLVDTNKLEERFGLDGFTDDFKTRLHRILTQDLGQTAALIGGRVLVLHMDPNLQASWLYDAVKKTKESVLNDAGLMQRVAKRRAADKEEFIGIIQNLQFFAAHEWIDATTEAHMESRADASVLMENRLNNAFKSLNGRLELLEKNPNEELRQHIQNHLKDTPANQVSIPEGQQRILIFPYSIATSLRRAVKEQDANLLEEYDALFQQGRSKAIPLFNYHTGKIPRLSHNNVNWLLGKGAALTRALHRLQGEPQSEERLQAFKTAYAAYRLVFWQSLALAYRDPRLPEIFKLEGIDEWVEADSRGSLKHLAEYFGNPPAFFVGQQEALHTLWLSFAPSKGYLFKRSVGDEIGVVTPSLYPGLYWQGFAELNKANAYFSFKGTDDLDSVYHRILLELLQATRAYIAQGTTGKPAWGFLYFWDQAIQHVAPEAFTPTEKVLTPRGIERMEAFQFKTDPSPAFPPIVRDRQGQYFKRALIDPSHWIPLTSLKETSIEPFKTHLTAARLYFNELVRTHQIQKIFNRLSKLVGQQKDPKRGILHEVVDHTFKVLPWFQNNVSPEHATLASA